MKPLWTLAVSLLALLAVPACGAGDVECNESCRDSSDCIEDHSCIAVGDPANTVCLPEDCDDCGAQACAVTAPVEGECSFRACM